MKYKGRRQSANVDDRRGLSPRNIAVGGGIGAIITLFIAFFLGGDPSGLIDLMQGEQGTETAQTSEREENMAEFVSVVLADTEDVWHQLFDESGRTYREPTLVLFRDQVESACGFSSAASGPFYCPGDEKIYIDLSFCDVLRDRFGVHGDFAVAYVIAHEVGHHVQKLLGILERVQSQQKRLSRTDYNSLMVRLELQADFLAGLWAHHAHKMLDILEPGDLEEALNAAAAVGDDAIQLKSRGRVVPDDFTHGTSAQRKKWFKLGFDAGDLTRGDTFSETVVL
jgi:predicted metalloprotease